MPVPTKVQNVHTVDAAMGRIIVDGSGNAVPLASSGIGAPVRRHDGDEKATGAAKYAGEELPRGTVYGIMVKSHVANGRLRGLDTDAASRMTGVVRILTAADMPEIGEFSTPPVAQSFVPMTDDRIQYEGQPVALVVAETLQQAQAAADAVGVDIERRTPTVFETASDTTPPTENNGYALGPTDPSDGSVSSARATAAARVDHVYIAPTRHHNMMEPSATLAEWRDGELHIHDSTQWTFGVQMALAAMLGIEQSKIHVRCPYTGGGFGAKGYVWTHQFLAPIAAREIGRPVKIPIKRSGCYTDTGYQPIVRSRVALSARSDGTLTGIEHDSSNVTSMFDDYVEYGNMGSRGMYNPVNNKPAYAMKTRVRHANVSTPTAMRAPHEGPGMFALESAMDELAVELGMDPLELRLRNYAETDLESGKPFSAKSLRQAYNEGARRIGWSDRRAPRQRREGNKLVGLGMASAIMSTFRFQSSARCCLEADGTVTVEAGTQEIGTGTRTIFTQVAAERLGMSADNATVKLGSTDLPQTGGTFGSSSTISVGSAVADAADNLARKIADLNNGTMPPPERWAALMRERGITQLEGNGSFDLPGGGASDAKGGDSPFSMHTFGAVFAEVEVDEALGLARLRRFVGSYSAGRILNPVTARSQMIGGIIWGYGRAMLEESAMDERYGRYLSKNLSGIHLPVNADIPQDIDVCFIEEDDRQASAIGVRGIGELGEVGVAAALTNAIYNATGRRVRELPVKFEDLLA